MSSGLAVTDLQAGYAGAPAISGVDLQVRAKEVVAVVGANGAGKTTLLLTLAGLVRRQRGRIELDGERIDHLGPAERLRRGIALVPDGSGVFAEMTVEDNLRVAAFTGCRPSFEEQRERAFQRFPVLRRMRRGIAANLSGGERRMLAIAMALMPGPRILLCDEVSMGLAPVVILDLFAILRKLADEEDIGILLVEERAAQAVRIADRGIVLRTGAVAHAGDARTLLGALDSGYL